MVNTNSLACTPPPPSNRLISLGRRLEMMKMWRRSGCEPVPCGSIHPRPPSPARTPRGRRHHSHRRRCHGCLHHCSINPWYPTPSGTSPWFLLCHQIYRPHRPLPHLQNVVVVIVDRDNVWGRDNDNKKDNNDIVDEICFWRRNWSCTFFKCRILQYICTGPLWIISLKMLIFGLRHNILNNQFWT